MVCQTVPFFVIFLKQATCNTYFKEVKIYHLGEMDMKIVALFPEAVEGQENQYLILKSNRIKNIFRGKRT